MSVNVVNDDAAPAASKSAGLERRRCARRILKRASSPACARPVARSTSSAAPRSARLNAAFVAQGAFDELDAVAHDRAVGVIELIAQVQALEALLHDVEGVAGIGKRSSPNASRISARLPRLRGHRPLQGAHRVARVR